MSPSNGTYVSHAPAARCGSAQIDARQMWAGSDWRAGALCRLCGFCGQASRANGINPQKDLSLPGPGDLCSPQVQLSLDSAPLCLFN